MNAQNHMNSPLTQRLANAPNDTLLHIINIHIKASLFEELHELITPDLMREKRKRYGSHQSFIRDLELTIQALPGEGLNGLPHLMFYSMLYSTLRSMSTNVTPEVLRVSAAFGNMERAKAYAGTTPDPYQKALAYQILGGGGGGEKAQKKEKTDGVRRKLSRELIQRAFSESLQIEKNDVDSKFFSVLASDLAMVGDLEAARACAQQIDKDEPYDLKDKTLKNISVELARSAKKSEALQVYEQLEEGYFKAETLKHLVAALAKAGLTKDALNMILSIDENEGVVESVADVWQLRRDWLQNAISLARGSQNIEGRSRFISTIAIEIDDFQQEIELARKSEQTAKASKSRALLLLWLGKYDEVLNILKTLDVLKTTNINLLFTLGREYELDVFLKILLILGRFEDAEYLIENGWAERNYLDMLPVWEYMYSNLGKLIRNGKLDAVFAGIEDIEPKNHQADAMLLMGPQLARLGRIKDIVDFFEKNKDDDHFDALSHQLATCLAHQGMFEEAELLMSGFLDSSVRFSYIAEVAGSLISLGRYTEILQPIKRHYPKISEQLETIAYIAEKLAPEDRSTALKIMELGLIDSEAVELTFADKVEILTSIAFALTRTGHLEKAVVIAKHLAREQPNIFSEIISELVEKSLNTVQAQSLLAEVLEYVKSIPDDPDHAISLERQIILNYLVGALARRNQFEHAITVTSNMDDDFLQKPLAFAELAGRLATKDKKEAEIILNSAIKLVKNRKGTSGKESSGYSSLLPKILPLFVAPTRVKFGKWNMLFPTVGPFKELVEIEEGTGMSLIAAELLRAGWVEKALEIAKSLKVESVRLQIQTYAAILIADLGHSDDTHKLVGGSENVSSHIDALKAWGYEIFDPNMLLKAIKYASSVQLGLRKAKKLAKELIEHTEFNNKGKVFSFLAAMLLVNGCGDELLDLLESIPDELEDKLEIQITSISYLMGEKKNIVASRIADSIEDAPWKTLLRSLIETNKVQFIDIEQFLPMLIQFVNGATEIAQRTESDAIKSWLSVQSANGLMALSEMKEMLTIVHGISNLDFRYRIMSEISIRLVKKGLIEDAHRIYQEIGEQKIRDATVTLVVHELDGLDPKKAIHGFYTFLYDLINGEFKSVCHSISQVIPLITKLAGPDRGAELVWTAYEQILRVDSFWMQKDLVT